MSGDDLIAGEENVNASESLRGYSVHRRPLTFKKSRGHRHSCPHSVFTRPLTSTTIKDYWWV